MRTPNTTPPPLRHYGLGRLRGRDDAINAVKAMVEEIYYDARTEREQKLAEAIHLLASIVRAADHDHPRYPSI